MIHCVLFSALLLSVTGTPAPTFQPTNIPTSILEIPPASIPIAMHQLVVVENAGSSVIRFRSFDQNSFNMIYKVASVPSSGSIYQLSQVYSSYGYEPKGGEIISNDGKVVTGSNNRIYYKRPTPDAVGLNKWDSFTFTVTSAEGVTSEPGTVTLVPPSGAIVGSSFLLSNEGWTIEGNRAASYSAGYEPYSRGALLNHYILGTEDKVNVRSAGAPDQSLWYFVAPGKFLGNLGISYGGQLQFSLSSFSGDFSKENSKGDFVVLLECGECEGPVGSRRGITLGYSVAALTASPSGPFTGSPLRVSIPLREQEVPRGVPGAGAAVLAGGWVKDPQNALLPWSAASQCDLIQVLSRLSKVSILGDWTAWYETVGLDDVRFENTKAPGKAILFGEHAVVYGTTAVAASLSDMRICSDMRVVRGLPEVEVTFEDIVENGLPSVVRLSFAEISALVPTHRDPYDVLYPDDQTKASLATLFTNEQSSVRSGMTSIVYILGKILSRFVRNESDMTDVSLKVNIKSFGLPIGAGLGSSASFSVAAVASALRLQALLFPNQCKSNRSLITSTSSGAAHVTPASEVLGVINGWAFASEILLHGSPSGLDNTTSCYGGLVKFSRKGGEKFENIMGVPALHILLVNTRVPRSTKQLVAGVRCLHDAYPDTVALLLESMNNIALKFLALVEELKDMNMNQNSDKYEALVKQTGDLMVMNHHLLNAVGVGHPALTAVVEAAATAGAAGKGEGEGSFPGFACKLTGAGGGGCAIILSPVPYAPSFPGPTTSTQEQSPLAATGAVERALDSLVDKLR